MASNNEKKITTLKNIFKAQRIQIGEKLTPKVNVLEESLIRTNAIITDVAAQLENGELIIADVKATSRNTFDWNETFNKYDYAKAYKRQLEMYQWLFRKNGFNVPA